MASMSAAETAAEPRVLCVDDEPRVLEGLENHLAMEHDVSFAASGAEGLELIASEAPFAVVLSDMRMPNMNGAAFLSKVRERSPDATRMLLTGQSDIESAIAAVNEGQIFRFLSKPCAPQNLLRAVKEGIRQNQLLRTERDLLQNTLNGAVGVLTEVMSLTTPAAFARVSSLKSCVRHMCEKLGIHDTWQYEVATSLTQLGCITLPPDTLDKFYACHNLSTDELSMLEGHPLVGQRLLGRIPRLEAAAAMIGNQHKLPEWSGQGAPSDSNDVVALGSNLLAVALALDELLVAGKKTRDAIGLLRKSKQLNATLLATLVDYQGHAASEIIQVLPLESLRSFMVLDEDVMSKAGNTIVSKGLELNQPLLERLRNFANGVGVIEPIRVRVPAS